MKRSYWFMIVAAIVTLLVSIIGWLVEPHIPEYEGWLYLKLIAYKVRYGGLLLAGMFLLFGGMNWLGSRWDINSEKLDSVQMYLVIGGVVSAFTGLALAIIDGAMSTLAKVGLFGFGFGGIIMFAIAFFIRGMVREKTM